jgi:hypothetical protein
MNPVARQRRTLHAPLRTRYCRRHRRTDSLSQHLQPRAT